jgi:mycofactocin precursor peptide peptidase
VPIGSLEQHGPHLPLDTDTAIADAVTRGVAARLLGAWVAPPIAYGASGEHQSFPGTISIGTDVLSLVVVEMVRSLRTWASRIVLVNAHGGNVAALTRAVDQLTSEGHDVAWVPCATEAHDLHAGFTETSLMLHLRPGAVRLDQAEAGCTAPLAEILESMVAGGVSAVSPSGILGDPAGATAEEGRWLLNALVDDVCDRLATVGAR